MSDLDFIKISGSRTLRSNPKLNVLIIIIIIIIVIIIIIIIIVII
jgi:hypothetical protein